MGGKRTPCSGFLSLKMIRNYLFKWYIVTVYCLSNRSTWTKLYWIFKNVDRLTPLPLILQVLRACEAGLALLPGSNGAAWEHGGSWQAARQDLASCSTSAAPLQQHLCCSPPAASLLLPCCQPSKVFALQGSCQRCLCLPSTFLLVWPQHQWMKHQFGPCSWEPLSWSVWCISCWNQCKWQRYYHWQLV